MWGMRNTDKLIEQNNLLKLKVAIYEAKDPIREFQRNCENRVKYATEKMNEYKDALLNSHSEVKGLQGELSELKKKLVKVEKSRAAMHDHLSINYRKEYLFQNIECIQHMERDLQKVYNDSGHEWAMMKVSGQFLNEETASEFAKIRTYTETCKRNGVDEFEALYRLMSGNPYTLAEIIEKEKV